MRVVRAEQAAMFGRIAHAQKVEFARVHESYASTRSRAEDKMANLELRLGAMESKLDRILGFLEKKE